MGPHAQSLPPTELRLTSVEVSFLAKRPKSRMKLVIKLDGKDHEVEIDEGNAVRWTGTIRCLTGTKIVIDTLRRRIGLWKQFASVEASLTEHMASISDDERQITVTLTIEEPRSDGPPISDVVEEIATARARVADKLPILEKLSPILRVLKVIRAIGEPLKDINPAVGFAIGAIGALVEICEIHAACRDEASDLLEELMAFLSVEGHVDVLKKRRETRRAVNVMVDLISEASNYICEKTSTGVRGMIGDMIGNEYMEKITKLKAEFGRAKESFDRSVQLEIFAAIDGVALTTQWLYLHEKLSECENAHFKADGSCLHGTRADLRQRILDWIEDASQDQAKVFWLYGTAGSGKSTVANTIASMVKDDRKHHLSCFFCKQDDPDTSNPRRLFPTLAYRFSQQHESYRAAIITCLQDGTEGVGIATTATVKFQFDMLFKEMLTKTVDPLKLHVIVIDALDECGSAKEQAELAAYILALSRTVPWVKVFITSRDEPTIHHVFSQTTDCILCNINEEKGTDGDIRAYIEAQAQELDDPLTDADVAQLVKRADGLFIWCRTVFEYLRHGIGATSFLENLLSGEKQDQSPHPWTQLYMLYDKVLDSALGNQTPDAVSFMRAILSIVEVSSHNRPLSVDAIMSFLHARGRYTQFLVKDAEKVVKRLHSVLYIGSAVRASHASFYDFLRWKASTSGESVWEASGEIHGLMVQACITILNKQLKFNICEIDTPVLNKDVPDLAARISTHMSEELQYSTRFWFTHLSPSTLIAAEVAPGILELLCSKKLLFLLEGLSLQGSLRQDELAFQRCLLSFFQANTTIAELIKDIHRFVTFFADAMDSIPHIYLSALLWLPEDTLMYKILGLAARQSWHLIKNKTKTWDADVWHFYGDSLRSAIFSPNGRSIAYGGADGNVYIRNLHTGALEGEPLRHQNRVCSLAFSPDGYFLVSGSSDSTVRIWDVKTGRTILGPLEGDSNFVNNVAYSPDGLFVACSFNTSIRISNTQTGETEGEPLLHSGRVSGLAYSPDGRFIASACFDQCIHVWDTSSFQEAVAPFRGHQGWVLCVAYSPDGCNIVSGSWDKTIRVWDAQTGETMGDPLQGHTSDINSVIYSPDGRFILSSSHNGSIRLWDAASHTPIGELLDVDPMFLSYSPDNSLIAYISADGVHVLDGATCFIADHQPHPQDHAVLVDAPAWSPDGLYIASGSNSDQTRIWNAKTGAAVEQHVFQHVGMKQGGSVTSVAYSPDGRFIASASEDGDNNTICILDVHTGVAVGELFRGHPRGIYSVTYSPDGCHIASASWDSSVRLWNVRTNTAVGKPVPASRCAAFSSDGRVLVSGTEDGYIQFRETHTGESIRDPIQVYTGKECAVRSVAFSPDGRHIILTGLSTVSLPLRVWDAQTGEESGVLLQRSEEDSSTYTASYSPNGRFIVSRSWGCIMIHDAQTGTLCGAPLRCPTGGLSGTVSYSPDGRFIAAYGLGGKIYVYSVPSEHGDAEARWVGCCSQINMRDGWIKDGKTLLLWIPTSYRLYFQAGIRVVIPNPVPNITAYSVDYETLFKYSGTNWTDIFSSFKD